MSISRDFANDTKFFARVRAGQPRRKPLRSFREMAEEFEVSQARLRGLMSTSHIPVPTAQIVSTSAMAPSNKYYDPDAMREWWRLYNADK